MNNSDMRRAQELWETTCVVRHVPNGLFAPSHRIVAQYTVLYTRQTSPRRLPDVLETSGRRLGDVWESSGSRLGVVWETSGSRLGVVWESSGRCLGVVWESSGRHLGDGNGVGGIR